MWKTVSNIIGESIQAVGVLMGSRDVNRELKKTLNSAERFVSWGIESNSPIDFQEALRILSTANIANASVDDKIKIFQLKCISQIGIIGGKAVDMQKFDKKIQKKYDTDEYMEEVISTISANMKRLQEIIAAADALDAPKLRQLIGDKKVQEVRPEEISLDARKEYEMVEDSFIMKKSVLENKKNEISNFKASLVTEIATMKDVIDNLVIEIENLNEKLTEDQIKLRNQYKEEIYKQLQITYTKLNDAGIPLLNNQKAKK